MTGLLAQYLDDCWEPEDAERILRELAGGPQAGEPLCLRVEGEDARVIDADHEIDRSERPGTARYLWVLWTGTRPAREELLELLATYPPR